MENVPDELFDGSDKEKSDDMMKIDLMSETPDQIFAEDPMAVDEVVDPSCADDLPVPTEQSTAAVSSVADTEAISSSEVETRSPTDPSDEKIPEETIVEVPNSEQPVPEVQAAPEPEDVAEEVEAETLDIPDTPEITEPERHPQKIESSAEESKHDEEDVPAPAVPDDMPELIKDTDETEPDSNKPDEETINEEKSADSGKEKTRTISEEASTVLIENKGEEENTVKDSEVVTSEDAVGDEGVAKEKDDIEEASAIAESGVEEGDSVEKEGTVGDGATPPSDIVEEEVAMETEEVDTAIQSQVPAGQKTIDVQINGAIVTAEITTADDQDAVMEEVRAQYIPESDIVTELPASNHSDENVVMARPHVFAQIIEEEIIEEETVERYKHNYGQFQHSFPPSHFQPREFHSNFHNHYPGENLSCQLFNSDSSVMMRGEHLSPVPKSDDFITSLDNQQPPRRLQAREDAAKRKDETMLLSTKKIIDSTDDVLRSAQALLKSTDVNKEGEVEPTEGGQPRRQVFQGQQREKRQKKKKPKVDLKEKEVDPDYDPADDFDDKAYLTPKDLEGAAFASRLPADRMTKQEVISFPLVFKEPERQKTFLYIRNRLLFVWLEDPKTKLVAENAIPRIEPPHNEDEKLIRRVFEYLNRYGFINFGVYDPPSSHDSIPATAPKVLIVGAGVSGLTAARQLQEFGIRVEIIEARSVVGGRVSTFRDGPHVADLGAMVVTGLGGNPLAVLAKQLNLDLMPIKQDCPLYEFTGQMVPKERDERVEREFNRLLEATTYMSHQLNVNSINGRPVSLGQALEIIIKLQIRQVKEKQLKHGRERCEIQEKLNHIQQALFPLHEKIKDSHSKYLELKMKHEELSDQLGEVIRDQKAEYEVKKAYKVMLETFAEYDALLKEQQELEVQLTKMEQMVPNEIYMTPQERHVLDWHCANLEFANAAPLSALSLKHWDQDDDFEFTGNHLVVHDGMSTIPDAMSKDLQIRYNTACVGIKYTDDGVEVATREVNQNNNSWATNTTNTTTADAVLLTIPLGVLKKEKLKFEPALPEWKTSAIKRMGFGNLNKVVLCFNKVFWDPSIHLFGHVSNSTISRGELFLFWSVSKAPVLIALIAGEAATVIETVPDEAIVGRAMTILRAIFGFQTVPQPNKHRVTRWRGDAWALGSYSYVAAGSSGNDYDDLARPVAPTHASSAHPRVFFAGEHTIRNYPATVHGAMLSGLREAGRIADQFLGPPSPRDAAPSVST